MSLKRGQGVIYPILAAGLALSSSALAQSMTLIDWLTSLSRLYAIPLIYNAASFRGTHAPNNCDSPQSLSASHPIDTVLNRCLAPLNLSWQQTAAGIIIRRAKPTATKEPMQQSATLEEVTVTGHLDEISPDNYIRNYANATRYAKQIKRSQVSDTEVLLGAMLTRLPAENLAESLQSLPGLSITRDRGEALNINAMGLGADYQMTLMNGHRLANTENVRNSNQYGQQYRFDTLSAGLFNEVVLHKTPAVQLPSGAVGATVNLKSDNPLAYVTSGIDARLTMAALQGDRNLQPGFSFTANGVNNNKTLGGQLKINYENRLQRQFQFETWHWGENSGAPDAYQWPDIDAETLVPTDGLALTIENEDRTRATYFANIAWRPTPYFSTEAIWLRSDTDFAFDEHRLAVNPVANNAKATVGPNNSLNEFVFKNARLKSTREESGLYYANNTVQLSADWKSKALQGIRIHPYLSSSEATSNTQAPITRTHVAMHPAEVRVALGQHSLSRFKLAYNPALVDSYSHLSQMSKRQIEVENTVDEWGTDVFWQPASFHWLDELSGGVRLSSQSHQYQRWDVSLSLPMLEQLPTLDGRWLEPLPINFHAPSAVDATTYWLLPKRDLFQLFDINLPFGDISRSDRLNSYHVTFKSTEAYIRGRWPLLANDTIILLTGIRYSDTESLTTGASLTPTGVVKNTHFRQQYHAWLPALQLRWAPTSHWQWRVGLTKAQNRPNYSDLNPKFHANSGGLPYAEAGNPLLKPVTSVTATTSIWWSQDDASTEIMAFSHQLKHYIVEEALLETINNRPYNVLRKTNNGEATVTGLQLSGDWQIPRWSGYSGRNRLAATLTHVTDASVSIPESAELPVEGVSRWTSNLRLLAFWETWQGAININYRSQFLELRDQTNNADTYVDDYLGVDLSLSWLFSPQTSIRLDVYNATNELLIRHATVPHASALMKTEEFGRRFLLSLSVVI